MARRSGLWSRARSFAKARPTSTAISLQKRPIAISTCASSSRAKPQAIAACSSIRASSESIPSTARTSKACKWKWTSYRDSAQWHEDRGLYGRGAQIHGWRDWIADSYRRRREDEVEGYFYSGEVESGGFLGQC